MFTVGKLISDSAAKRHFYILPTKFSTDTLPNLVIYESKRYILDKNPTQGFLKHN